MLTKIINSMKRKLLLAAVTLFAAVFFGGGNSLNAKENVTSTYLKDADLSSLNGWGNPGRTDWKTDGAVNVVEFWNWTNQFNFSQKAQLPAGYYRLAVNAFYRESWGGNGTNNNMAWIFAGGKTQNVIALNSMNDLSGYAGGNDLYRAATAFSQGKFSNEFDFTVTGEGTTEVEIGFRGTCPNGGWCILGPVTLYQYTVDDYIEDYRKKVDEEAKPLYNKPMNATVLAELQAAVVEESSFQTVDDVMNAIQALNVKINAASISVEYYEKIKAVIDACAAHAATFDTDGQNAYATESAEAIADYNNGDATDGSDQIEALNEALSVACKAQTQPADGAYMTPFIENPSFESGWDGWTNNGMAIQNNNSFAKVGTNYAEAWEPNGTKNVSQTIMQLPKGKYRLSATSKARGVNWARIFAGEDETVITIEDATNTYNVEFLCLSNVTIGFEGDGSGAGSSWLCVDDFQLTYVCQLTGEEEAAFAKVDYNLALQAAQAIEDGSIPATNYTTLQGLINNPLPDGSTAAQYEAATETLNNAVTAATAIQAPYATWTKLVANAKIVAPQDQHPAVYNAIETIENYVENNLINAATLEQFNMLGAKLTKNYSEWLELLAYAMSLKDVSNNNASANATLVGEINTQVANISNSSIGSLEDAAILTNTTIPTAIITVKNAMISYIQTAEPTNDECFDLTFMLVNPHFTEGEGGMDKVAAGWTLESGTVTEHRLATHNFEAYHMTFNLSQTIKDLPTGTYKVTLQGFARHDNNGPTDKTNLYCGGVNQAIKSIKDEYSETSYYQNGDVQMGDGNYDTDYELGGETVYQPNGMTGAYYWFQEKNQETGQPFYTNEVQTFVTAGDLKIGFSCETTTDWVIWDNFHLYYYGSAIDVTIDETVSKTFSEGIENATVTLNRTIKKGLNSVVLPFSMDQDEVEAFFGTDSKVYKVGSFDAEKSSITFEIQEGVVANEPCILDATKPGTSYQLTGRTIEVKSPTVTVDDLSFIGSYEASITITENANNYILYNGSLYLVDSDNVTLKGTRAYFHVGGSNAREIAVTFEGSETTGIAEIDGEKAADGVIYNLAGQAVGADYKGIVIINGKKVLK